MSNTIKRWNTLVITSAVLGSAYVIYLMTYMAGSVDQGGSSAEKAGVAIALTLMTPHLVLVLTAVILNIVTVFTNSPIVALLTAIFYSIAALVFLLYILFVIPSIVLSWIGYTQLRKRKQANVVVSQVPIS